MSNPILSGVGVGSSLIGNIIGIGGQQAAGQASAASQSYQAGIAALNAKIAAQNATYAIIQGEKAATQYGLAAKQKMGDIVTAQSASGLDLTSGSAKRVQESQQMLTQMDLNSIRENAAKTAYDFKAQSAQYTTQAMMGLLGAQKTMAATDTSVLGSLIGAAGSVADKWLAAKPAFGV